MNEKELKVFMSYSHVDEGFKEKLEVHLSPLKRNKKICSWNDSELLVGTMIDDEINKHLEHDDIIILLVSADFINSDYCYGIEMEKAIERCKKGECKIVPVILRPCLWKETPLKKLLCLPRDGKAISMYENEDSAYLEVVTALNKIIENY
ncbi:MAG: toll/interleukin-1 receptor domain-containing protein [Lachnospiraceae bacterium]|nr:toll/interleukin-1 receptor domain-containing protein [Lachnospiraceae bacterium]